METASYHVYVAMVTIHQEVWRVKDT